MYDSIIIGTGPAGLSAALNLKTYKRILSGLVRRT